jgi:hypothetical protein
MSDFHGSHKKQELAPFFYRDRAFDCYYYYWFFSSFTEVNLVAQFPCGHLPASMINQSKKTQISLHMIFS